MAKTQHWEDTSQYAVLEMSDGKFVLTFAGGGGFVVLDHPDKAEVDAMIDELIQAGCPVVHSHEEFRKLVEESRGRPRWELAGLSDITLWQDRWGTIWLRSTGSDQIAGAAHLSKYEALGLAEKLLQLSQSAPEPTRG